MAPHRQHWARHHRFLAGILIGAITIGCGLLIAQDQETLRIKTPLAIEDQRFLITSLACSAVPSPTATRIAC